MNVIVPPYHILVCNFGYAVRKVALDGYDDWRTIAMALSTLGEDGWPLLADNRRKFEGFLSSTREITLESFFYKCQEYGVIPPNVPHYEMIPFPVEVFPEQVRAIIRETHECLNFSVDHIASSLLFVASIAVGYGMLNTADR